MPQSLKQACYLDLQQRILTLELAPGSELDESSLSAEYGLSRTPLREVFQRLSGDGYLVTASNRSAKVASMDISTMRIFFQTAPLVYANMAKLAAENRKTSEVHDLRDVQSSFKAAVNQGDANAASLANHRFHATIGEMARNVYLLASLERLLIDHTRLSQTFYRPTEPRDEDSIAKAVEQHDAMISAIEAREPALAMELTLQHWDLSRDRIERFVQPDPLPLDVVSMKDHKNAV